MEGLLWSKVPVQVPLVASNRVGTEKADKTSITFYGGSFIAGPTGEIKHQVKFALQPRSLLPGNIAYC